MTSLPQKLLLWLIALLTASMMQAQTVENIRVDIEGEKIRTITGSTLSPYGVSAGSVNNLGFYVSVRMGTNNDTEQNEIWWTDTGFS